MIRRPRLSRERGERRGGLFSLGAFDALFLGKGIDSIGTGVVPVAKRRRAKLDNDVCALKVR